MSRRSPRSTRMNSRLPYTKVFRARDSRHLRNGDGRPACRQWRAARALISQRGARRTALGHVKRLPLLPTLLVALAATAMVALGVWQLHRKTWKEHLLAHYAANETLPPIAFPATSFGDEALFRTTYATCAHASNLTRDISRIADGNIGGAQIAHRGKAA